MIEATLERWAAWSPGCQDSEAWQRWAASPAPLDSEGRPDVSFLPALLRRRCSPLARVMLAAAFAACPPELRSPVATVFASRHGNINESIDLLWRLARRQPLSPTRFSHTVHNAQAGLFSIAAENRQASSSIAACEDTFACGWLEALTLLERDPERPVLLVVGDVPLSETFAGLVEEPPGTYAVAFLLGRGEDAPISFGTARAHADAPRLAWPDAVEFLRWHLAGEPRLELDSGRRQFVWQRA